MPEPLRFDPTLILLEEPSKVSEWLTGKTGVVLPNLEVALPYLPPFFSSLASLSALLKHKKALTTSTLHLLPQGEQDASEKDRVATIRQLVAERFESNPGYLLLKARFLSCYTLPAFLATINPISEKNKSRSNSPTNDEEEEVEEEEHEEQAAARDEPTTPQSSLLITDGSGDHATHYSGITTRNKSHLPTS